MSQQHIEVRGAGAVELRRVDRVLAELARPVLNEDCIAPSTRDALLQLGICVGGDVSRRDLVEQVWSRKRSLLRQMSALGDGGPLQPVA